MYALWISDNQLLFFIVDSYLSDMPSSIHFMFAKMQIMVT